MRILIDHCVDRRLSRSFPARQVKSAAQMGWQKLRNGKLLASAAGQFDVMLTVDRNIRNQQNLGTRLIGAGSLHRTGSNHLIRPEFDFELAA